MGEEESLAVDSLPEAVVRQVRVGLATPVGAHHERRFEYSVRPELVERQFG